MDVGHVVACYLAGSTIVDTGQAAQAHLGAVSLRPVVPCAGETSYSTFSGTAYRHWMVAWRLVRSACSLAVNDRASRCQPRGDGRCRPVQRCHCSGPHNWSVVGADELARALVCTLAGFRASAVGLDVAGWWQIWLWLGQSQPLDDAGHQQTLAAAKRRVGITGHVDLRDCGSCTTPLVIGCFRPIILLPTVVRESLTPAELETVLVHELTHVARGDGWWRIVQALLGSIYFFHPAIWLARYKLNQLCEEACDEQTVFALAGERRDYAQAIVKAATIIGYQPPHLAMRMMSDRLPVKKRLQRILDPALPWSASGSWQRALLIALLACVLLPSGYRSSEATPPSQMRQLGLPAINVVEDVDAQLAALQAESPDASRDEELERLALEQVQAVDLDTRLQGYQALERVGTLRSLRELEAAFLSRRGLEQDAAKRALDHVWSIIRQLPTEPSQTSRQILND